jgi:release factor glutamine methyltransferase
LDGGFRGLRVVLSVLEKAPYFLKKNGWLLMEIGEGQAQMLQKKINRQRIWTNLRFVKDYNGMDRILVVRHG